MRPIAIVMSVGLALLSAPRTMSAQTNGEKLEISAFAVNMSNIATGANAMVQITVNGWSTAEERTLLITTVLEKGSDALLRALQKAPVKGRFRIPTARPPDPHHLSLGLDIRYAWQAPLPEGGRRIVLATDRYIGFQEARNQPRTTDYPITIMEIRVDKDGKGVGKMAVATKISFDKKKNQIELENYATEPVRLNNVEIKVKD
jgi:hypothetical protein